MKSLVPWKRGGARTIPRLASRRDLDLWTSPLDRFLSDWTQSFAGMTTRLDINEDEKQVAVRVEVPGLSKNDLQVTWENGVLQISGEKREEQRTDKSYQECTYGSFSRSVELGPDYDWSRAKATCRDGVLTVVLPKTESRAKSVTVKVV